MCLRWVSTGEAAEGQEKVDGARVGVAYTWVVHGHTTWNIRDEIPFLRVSDVPLLCGMHPIARQMHFNTTWCANNVISGHMRTTLASPVLTM
jgi:hypothetical protein